MLRLLAILGSGGRLPPIKGKGLNVKGHPHGVKHGWFNYPWNFDPMWLLECDGFEPLEDDLVKGK